LTIFFSAQESGTCLMQTAIFMSVMLLVGRHFGKPSQPFHTIHLLFRNTSPNHPNSGISQLHP